MLRRNRLLVTTSTLPVPRKCVPCGFDNWPISLYLFVPHARSSFCTLRGTWVPRDLCRVMPHGSFCGFRMRSIAPSAPCWISTAPPMNSTRIVSPLVCRITNIGQHLSSLIVLDTKKPLCFGRAETQGLIIISLPPNWGRLGGRCCYLRAVVRSSKVRADPYSDFFAICLVRWRQVAGVFLTIRNEGGPKRQPDHRLLPLDDCAFLMDEPFQPFVVAIRQQLIHV